MIAPPNAAKHVAAAIIEREGRYLIARRAPGQLLAGSWEFPGGKLEPGETPQSCIVRELAEELRVNVTAGEILAESHYEYPGGAIKLIAVATELEDQTVHLTVHDAFKWLLPNEIMDLTLAPADIPLALFLVGKIESSSGSCLDGDDAAQQRDELALPSKPDL